MPATSLPATWHRWRDKVADGMHPHFVDAEHPGSTHLSDLPIRERIRPVRLVPILVPGMALVLVFCALAIGSLLR